MSLLKCQSNFVLDAMRMRSVENRLAAILETEWKEEAATLLSERQVSGVGPVSSTHSPHSEIYSKLNSFSRCN
jgi:hypothetical protein